MKINYQNWSTNIFEGFYESNLFNSDTEYYINQLLQDEEHPEEVEIDFNPYCEAVAKYVAGLLQDYCVLYRHDDVIKDIKYLSISSPRFYNYTTDKLNLEIDFNMNNLKKFIKENKEDFNLYLKDNFTSYDGFISFIDNNYNDFMDKFYNDPTEKDRSLNVMLEYYILNCIYETNWMSIKDMDWNNTSYHYALYDAINEIQVNHTHPVAVV